MLLCSYFQAAAAVTHPHTTKNLAGVMLGSCTARRAVQWSAADTLGEVVAYAFKCLEGVYKNATLFRKVLSKVERARDVVW